MWIEAAIRIKKSLGLMRAVPRRDKNDKWCPTGIDSYGSPRDRIARYAYLHQDEASLWVPRREVIQQLAHLTTLRKRLLKIKVGVQQPLAETKSFLGKAAYRTEKVLSCPTGTDPVVAAEKQPGRRAIDTLIKADEHLKQLFDLVISVEAIGPVTAGHLLIVTNEFKNFDCPRKFVPVENHCYAGTAPFENSSGSSDRRPARFLIGLIKIPQRRPPKLYCIWQLCLLPQRLLSI